MSQLNIVLSIQLKLSIFADIVHFIVQITIDDIILCCVRITQ